ncbi:hypothetical protein HDU76_003145, partial [Blyttiomyces sp. JEL0837]
MKRKAEDHTIASILGNDNGQEDDDIALARRLQAEFDNEIESKRRKIEDDDAAYARLLMAEFEMEDQQQQ